MPKLLPDIKEKLIETARTELLNKGIDGLRMRDIAKKCGTSTGTVYNYFPSKEMLVASVMLVDWEAILARVKRACGSVASAEEGIREIYGGIVEFSGIYSFVHRQYPVTNENVHFFYGRHEKLISQLSELVCLLLSRFGHGCTQFYAKFISENILIAAADEKNDFNEYLALLKKTI